MVPKFRLFQKKKDPALSNGVLALFAAIGVAGFYIFRAANSQKDAFRRDPTDPAVKHLESMKTKRTTFFPFLIFNF